MTEPMKIPLKPLQPITDERLAQYLRVEHGITLQQVWDAQAALNNLKFDESNVFQKIVGLIWFTFIEQTGGITPKMLIKILTQLDQLLPFIPNEMAKKIIMVLDKIAEEVYKKL